MITVRFKPDHPDFEMPQQKTKGAAGFDLRYYGNESLTFSKVGDIHEVPLGFKMEIPPGYEAQIRPRSGLASKHGITLVNSIGTIDADYRGPVKAFLVKVADRPEFVINPGDRVVQMVLSKLPEVLLKQVEKLSETDRQEGGFGSTGMK